MTVKNPITQPKTFRTYKVKTPEVSISANKGYGKVRPHMWKWREIESGAGTGTIVRIRVIGTISRNIRVIENLIGGTYKIDAGITNEMIQRWSDINNKILPEGEENAVVKPRDEEERDEEVITAITVLDDHFEERIGQERLLAEHDIEQYRTKAMMWRAAPATTPDQRAYNLKQARKNDNLARKRRDQYEDTKKDLIALLKSQREEIKQEALEEWDREVQQYEERVEEYLQQLEHEMHTEIEIACNTCFNIDDEYIVNQIIFY